MRLRIRRHLELSVLWLFVLLAAPDHLFPDEPTQPTAFKHAGIVDAWTKYKHKLTFGKSQTLALVDDGCNLAMPEWSQSDGDQPKVLVTYDSVDGDDNPKHEGRGYHGSTIGVPSSLNYMGKWGVAYNDQLAVIRALECCHCNVSDGQTVAKALQWIVDNHERYRITTVNLAPVDDKAHANPIKTNIDGKLEKLRELGIWVSAPTGNHNFSNGISWPSCQPSCIAIGAVRPGKDEVYLDRHTNVDLVVPAAATSSSNAIACGAAIVIREAIVETEYDWKKDGSNLPDAILTIMQKTGVSVKDPATKHSFQRLDLCAALDHIFSAAKESNSVSFSEHLIANKYAYAYGVAAADLDRDGDLDLTSADYTPHNMLYLFENDGRGNFKRHFIQKDDPERLERHMVGDVDGDGDSDVVIVKNLRGDLLWFENSGTPVDGNLWQRHVITNDLPGAYDVALADFDKDGDLDVAASSWLLGNQFAWFENDGTPTAGLWKKHIIEQNVAETRTMAAGDFDRDGDMDLLGTGRQARQVIWYENQLTGNSVVWKKHLIDNTSACPAHGHPADIDGDGDLDVVMALGFFYRPGSNDTAASELRTDNQVVWYENNGQPQSGLWKKHIIGPRFDDAFEAVAADLDADGDIDVVATSWRNPGRIAWFENQGDPTATWTRHTLKNNWRSANQVIIADMNNDGRPDIVASAEHGSYELRWWRNEGSGQTEGLDDRTRALIARAASFELNTETVLPPGNSLEHHASGFAKILCSAVFVSGLDPSFAAENIGYFTAPHEERHRMTWRVDRANRAVHVTLPNGVTRTAKFIGDLGCLTLPRGEDSPFFEPPTIASALPDPTTTNWPLGDVLQNDPLPKEVDASAVAQAVKAAFEPPEALTAAFVVTWKGRIVGERYRDGITMHTPLESWSMGKSLTATLLGTLIKDGVYSLHQRAPIPEWQNGDDPRKEIRIADILHMSSGLRFRAPLDPDFDPTEGYPDHRYVYTGTINSFKWAATRPLQWPPNKVGRYRNSDPVLANYLIRLGVEKQGLDYHSYPQRALFDKLGMRDMVLETDPYGNFLLQGYEFGSARDWSRLGNLYLNDGVWNGTRVLPNGFVDFVSTLAPAWVADGRPIYGGFFWINGDKRFPIPKKAYYMAGAGGQYTIIIPSHDLVVVRMGHYKGSEAGFRALHKSLSLLMEATPGD